ncbi:MAG: DUF2029 domain-containing protein [Planctomycetes bacterium]|nr:DUF2029 domain-containing protein [Planctomycetota bacterium]
MTRSGAGGAALGRWLWPLLWTVLAIALVARATSRDATRGVILDHLEFGRRLLAGDDVYGPWRSDPDAPVRPLHAPYPPSYGLLTAPFAAVDALLGTRAARFCWALAQIAALAGIGWSLRRLTAGRAPAEAGSAWWHRLWLITFVLGARFILRDTHGGGGNLINVAFCLLAFVAAEGGRAGLAGALLGFSLATKPTQLWLLPVLLLLGHRRTVLWAVVAGVAAAGLTLLLQRFDVGPWLRWIEGSWSIATQRDPWADPALEFPPFEWMNQSLRFAVARWFGSVPPGFAARVEWGIAPPGLGLGVAAVGALARGLALALLAVLLVACHRRRGDPAARMWLFAGALVLSLLLSPLSWKAHHVALLPVLFLLAQDRRWFVLLGWFALCALPGRDLIDRFALYALPGREPIGDAADEWLNSVYVVTVWDIALLLLAVWCARRGAPRSGCR